MEMVNEYLRRAEELRNARGEGWHRGHQDRARVCRRAFRAAGPGARRGKAEAWRTWPDGSGGWSTAPGGL